MIALFLVQLLVPLALVAWLLFFPPRSLLGWIVQLPGSLVAMLGVARTGLWLFPPWWVPAAGAVALASIGAWQLFRRPWTTTTPRGVRGWAGAGVFLCAGVAGGYGAGRAHLAARLPEEPAAVDLSFPLEDGRYLVVNGGTWVLINPHRASMDSTIERLRPWRGNGHALDIVAIDRFGVRASGVLPRDPAAYHSYGVRVLAPCPGTVVRAKDGVPDLPVPQQDRAHMAGNHVILDCGGVHVVLAHFERGSVRVGAGDEVERGAWVASVGNSGMSSEPHLHIHAQLPGPPDAPMGGEPLPMRLGGRFLVRGDRVQVRTGM